MSSTSPSSRDNLVLSTSTMNSASTFTGAMLHLPNSLPNTTAISLNPMSQPLKVSSPESEEVWDISHKGQTHLNMSQIADNYSNDTRDISQILWDKYTLSASGGPLRRLGRNLEGLDLYTSPSERFPARAFPTVERRPTLMTVGVPLTAFALFPCLPFELRSKIWRQCLPRSKVIQVYYSKRTMQLYTDAKFLITLHVCSESRNKALRRYSILDFIQQNQEGRPFDEDTHMSDRLAAWERAEVICKAEGIPGPPRPQVPEPNPRRRRFKTYVDYRLDVIYLTNALNHGMTLQAFIQQLMNSSSKKNVAIEHHLLVGGQYNNDSTIEGDLWDLLPYIRKMIVVFKDDGYVRLHTPRADRGRVEYFSDSYEDAAATRYSSWKTLRTRVLEWGDKHSPSYKTQSQEIAGQPTWIAYTQNGRLMAEGTSENNDETIKARDKKILRIQRDREAVVWKTVEAHRQSWPSDWPMDMREKYYS